MECDIERTACLGVCVYLMFQCAGGDVASSVFHGNLAGPSPHARKASVRSTAADACAAAIAQAVDTHGEDACVCLNAESLRQGRMRACCFVAGLALLAGMDLSQFAVCCVVFHVAMWPTLCFWTWCLAP